MITFALAAALSALTLPDTTPIYCRDTFGEYTKLQTLDRGLLRETFERRNDAKATLTATSDYQGVLTFRSDDVPPATITIDVEPHDDGMLLLRIRTRSSTKTEDLAGGPLCEAVIAVFVP